MKPNSLNQSFVYLLADASVGSVALQEHRFNYEKILINEVKLNDRDRGRLKVCLYSIDRNR